jgi:hypothetical protein
MAPTPGGSSASMTEPDAGPSRAILGVTLDGALAVSVWLVGLAAAVVVVRAWDLDPFSVGGAVMPMGVGCAVGAVVVAAALRWSGAWVAGVATGLYAGWVALTTSTSLHGTPFGFGQMSGDAGRFTAMATRYTVTSVSSDPLLPSVPSEYPPLYPWVAGHLSRLLDRPAWTLMGDMQVVVLSAAFVAGYLVWRRCVGPWTAFALVALAPAVWADPSKDYELLALLVFIPWVLRTFVLRPGEGGLSWWAAGVVGGLLVTLYQAWLLYSVLALVVLALVGLRVAPDRRRHLLRLVGIGVTATAVASWYVIPLFWGLATSGAPRVSDLWMSGAITDRPLFLPFTETGPVAVIQVVGLLGCVLYLRRTWWSMPLLVLVVANYVYRIAYLVRTAHDNHTGYLQYTETVVGMVLLVAGILTVAHVVPAVLARVSLLPADRAATGVASELAARQRLVMLTATTLVVAFAAVQGWQDWIPAPRGLRNSVAPSGTPNRATDAHRELLPDGSRTRFAPGAAYQSRPFPAERVLDVVDSSWRGDQPPVVLSYDQRLFAFRPLLGYCPVDRVSTNTLVRWDDRAAELVRLSQETDPARFADRVTRTRFGRIDVFVLRTVSGTWRWGQLRFDPRLFDTPAFDVVLLPDNVRVAIRRPS